MKSGDRAERSQENAELSIDFQLHRSYLASDGVTRSRSSGPVSLRFAAHADLEVGDPPLVPRETAQSAVIEAGSVEREHWSGVYFKGGAK